MATATDTTPKYGSPEWKPISQTRKASITPKFAVKCHGCGPDVIGLVKTMEEAERIAAMHNANHSDNLGSCCMYATGPVCRCGNVLV